MIYTQKVEDMRLCIPQWRLTSTGKKTHVTNEKYVELVKDKFVEDLQEVN